MMSLQARLNINYSSDPKLSERIDRILLLAMEIAYKPKNESDKFSLFYKLDGEKKSFE